MVRLTEQEDDSLDLKIFILNAKDLVTADRAVLSRNQGPAVSIFLYR